MKTNEVKGLLRAKKAEGKRIVEVVVDKDCLKATRKLVNDNSYTEAKLLYRNGAYLMTIILEQVSPTNVALAGFRKLTKEEKEDLKAKSIILQ